MEEAKHNKGSTMENQKENIIEREISPKDKIPMEIQDLVSWFRLHHKDSSAPESKPTNVDSEVAEDQKC